MSEGLEKIIQKLRAPFPFEETEWKIQAANKEKTRGLAVVYINSRAIQKRLDETVGPYNWQNEYMPWQDKSQICGISIFDESRGMWVKKCDGAENTNYEPVKGGLSDAFKRAAVIWGIGRYLYDIDSIWVEIEQKGSSSLIKDAERPKLKAHYEKFIRGLSGSAAPSSGNQAPAPVQSPQKNQSAPEKPAPATKAQPKQPDKAAYDYEIKSAAESGNSSCLKLVAKDGEVLTAYVKKDSPGIKPGARIKNVKMDKKEASFGAYYLLNQYDMAA